MDWVRRDFTAEIDIYARLNETGLPETTGTHAYHSGKVRILAEKLRSAIEAEVLLHHGATIRDMMEDLGRPIDL